MISKLFSWAELVVAGENIIAKSPRKTPAKVHASKATYLLLAGGLPHKLAADNNKSKAVSAVVVGGSENPAKIKEAKKIIRHTTRDGTALSEVRACLNINDARNAPNTSGAKWVIMAERQYMV